MPYQPRPKAQREDCENRYLVIKDVYGSFEGKSMVDIGCANGYFGSRFLEDGGVEYYGVNDDIGIWERKFDIGLYLDLHYHKKCDGDKYLDYLKRNCRTVFVSATGRAPDNQNNLKLSKELRFLFKRVLPIYQGFEERKIYLCE